MYACLKIAQRKLGSGCQKGGPRRRAIPIERSHQRYHYNYLEVVPTRKVVLW